jgi:exopolysaccharide production protein ExoZ
MGKLRNVQALRFFAALAVIFFHLTYIFETTPVIQGPLYWLRYTGFAGVDVFFVISGFIIYTVSARLDWSAPPAAVAGEFFARRLVRVYPIYWIYFGIFAALAMLGAKSFFRAYWSFEDVELNFFLLNRNNKLVPVAWTLVYEMFFYLCFSVALLFGRRHYRKVLTLWLSAEVIIGVANHFMSNETLWGPWRWQVFSNPLVIEFAIGCLVGFLAERGYLRYRTLAAVLAIAFFAAGGYWASTHTTPDFHGDDYRPVTFGIGAGLLVYSLSALEIADRIVAPAWLVRLGDASYSLYLCQELALYGVRYLFERADLIQLGWGIPAILLTIVAAILLSLVSYALLERPMVTRLQAAISRKTRNLRATVRRVPAGAEEQATRPVAQS